METDSEQEEDDEVHVQCTYVYTVDSGAIKHVNRNMGDLYDRLQSRTYGC